jgi:hypothetical protein
MKVTSTIRLPDKPGYTTPKEEERTVYIDDERGGKVVLHNEEVSELLQHLKRRT